MGKKQASSDLGVLFRILVKNKNIQESHVYNNYSKSEKAW